MKESSSGPDRVRLAVLQLDAVPGDVGQNMAKLRRFVEEHAGAADLLVAPELATTGYDLELLRDRGLELAEPADGPTATWIAEAASRLNTTLVVGFLEREGDRLYDSTLIATPDRSPRTYRKSHLYPPEVPVFAAGERLEVLDTPVGPVGPLICFEHAFPDVATTLARAGARILVIPSAVAVGYEHVLELRTRARAQDNQIFAIGCNMVGHGFCGRSLVADPRGEVVGQAGDTEEVLVVDLDLTEIERERDREPSLQMRRPHLYVDARGEQA